jgi:DNA-binding transcriptional LysR family regulator
MKIGIDDIRGFLAISELGGFKPAADRLGITSSALTQRIQKLEDYLGARLFDRSTRSVGPTELGRLFLPEAQRILQEFERSIARIQDVVAQRKGQVSVACLVSIASGLLPNILTRFRSEIPGVKVRVLDDTALRVADHLRMGRVEFGIDMWHRDDPEFDFEPIVTEPYVVACPKDHELAAVRAVTWDRLAKSNYVAFGLDSGIGRQLAMSQRLAGEPYEVQHLGTMLALIQAGFGVGVVPYSAIHGHPFLVPRPLRKPAMTRTLGIVRRKRSSLSPAAESLRRIAAETIAAAYRSLPEAELFGGRGARVVARRYSEAGGRT